MNKFVWLAVAGLLAPTSALADKYFDGLRDRIEYSTRQKAQGRVDQRVEEAIDGTEDAVKCVAGAADCPRREARQPDVTRCAASDTVCLRKAKAAKKQVEIVAPEELEGDTLRCVISDRACLNKARELGKKVELHD